MNILNIKRTYELMPSRKWEKIYILLDVHGVIIPGSWHNQVEYKFISNECKEVLQWMSKREDIEMILWTSSYLEEISNIVSWLKSHYITIDFANENPECFNTKYADFSKKPYFNIVVDDKSGFVPETDWLLVAREFEIVTGDTVINWTLDQKQRLISAINETKESLDKLALGRFSY